MNLTEENIKKSSKRNILSTSSSENYKKSNIKINIKPKYNLKKAKIKFENINTYYNSKDNSISKKSKSNSLKNYNSKSSLTEVDKRKIKSIIKGFKNNKVLTERLIEKEKILALNSVNNSNYSFLLNQTKNKLSRNKNRKLLYRNQYDDFSSLMINKFNNKTFGILDPPIRDPMYSTNLNYFRNQLINNFNEYNKNLEYARKKYNDAMKIGEIHERKNIKKAFDLEKKFYQNKYKILKDLNIKDINHELINNIKQLHGSSRNSYLDRNKEIVHKPLKMHKTTIIRTSSPKKDKIENYKINLKHQIVNKNNIDLFNKYIRTNKTHKSIIFNENNTENSLIKVKKSHKIKEQKNIIKRSSDYADSIYEINNYPYEEFDSFVLKENQGSVSLHNLLRAIKINSINKYIYNLEDDDLLIHNPKKLKDEIKKIQIECNKDNYRANYNMSFLRKKLKTETIRKFNNIKDSRFGFPT